MRCPVCNGKGKVPVIGEVAPLSPGQGAAPFPPGQVVRHSRWAYRGVIVAADDTCRTPAASSRLHTDFPARNQPWYFVLVHYTEQVTYVPHSSLEPDDSGDTVRHPYVPFFFDGMGEDGRYIRNGKEWS